ncbi:MAG: helix-turn-helix domain-containing protein [Pseudomonadota bacterium]
MKAADFVASYLEAWNRGDSEAVGEHLCSDGTYLDVPENLRQSREELISDLAGFFKSHNHRYELIGDILANENMIAFQYRMIPDGDENAPEIRGAEFIQLQGDSAVAIRDYYDVSELTPEAEAKPVHQDTVSGQARTAKYAKSGLDQPQLEAYKAQLERLMRRGELFLEPDLTLPRLASAMGCTVNHLSQVINAGFGMSFFDWISRLRIERARTLLVDPAHRDVPVLDIAFEVGFNSNSAFYSAFRKWVGKTPTAFRSEQEAAAASAESAGLEVKGAGAPEP